MPKINFLLGVLLLNLIPSFSFSQVDVVYNDLVWSDEFNSNGAVNATNWFHQIQLPNSGGWYNGELQHYTNLITNSFVSNGNLNIVAQKESFTDQGVTKQFTSARLNSKFAFKYGRIDVRAKVPKNQGSWPAIWLLGKNIKEPGGYYAASFGNTNWPACGEIDMMEYGIFPSNPANYIQSTLHTPSSSGNSVNHGGSLASSDISDNFHVYSMNWSPNQITFLLDGVPYYTYNPPVKNTNTWPFDAEQYLLLNVAMGSVAGVVPSNFTQASMIIDYVRVYQNTTPDTVAPSNFTATVKNITNSTVELLLNATDSNGAISYQVTQNNTTQTFYGTSGAPKSVIITGLNPNTTYTFAVSAKDPSGNAAANNPIIVTATTLNMSGCFGTNTTAQQGAFLKGYAHHFETIDNNVTITFELFDTDKVDVIAYLWKQSPFTETPMTRVSGNKFTQTIRGQTLGSTIYYAAKFAFAGGLSVTKYIAYVVGDKCTVSVDNFPTSDVTLYPNPIENILNIDFTEYNNNITIMDVSGKIIEQKKVDKTSAFNMSQYSKGVYFIKIDNSKGTKTYKVVKS